MEDNISALWSSHKEVRDRVVEIDKQVQVHETILDRYGRDQAASNSRISTQFGKFESTLESIQSNQEAIRAEQTYRRGAVNMLAWGIGLFCTVAALALTYFIAVGAVGP